MNREITEQLARKLCRNQNVDPDLETGPAREYDPNIHPGKKYKLWEYWEKNYVIPVLDDYVQVAERLMR